MGKHTGPQSQAQTRAEAHQWELAVAGIAPPLRGRHHKTCAHAIVRAHHNRWLASTEMQHLTRKEGHGLVQGR